MNEKVCKQIRRVIKQINPDLDPKNVQYSSMANNSTQRVLNPQCFRGMYQSIKRGGVDNV